MKLGAVGEGGLIGRPKPACAARGDLELNPVWKDTAFDPKLRAFYDARVIESPTPRWTAYDARPFGVTMLKEVSHDHAGEELREGLAPGAITDGPSSTVLVVVTGIFPTIVIEVQALHSFFRAVAGAHRVPPGLRADRQSPVSRRTISR